jgi:hypothetical protein
VSGTTTMNDDELLPYLDRLISVTNEEEIAWKPLNASTFIFRKDEEPPASLILQRVTGGRYVLQAVNNQTRETEVVISGVDNLTLNNKLQILFGTIITVRDRRAVEFLKSILPPEHP